MSQALRPIRMNAALKRDVSPAIRTSHASASANPPPAAGPRVAAVLLLQIEAGTKGAPRRTHHHHPRPTLSRQHMEVILQFLDHKRAKRIEILRPIKRKPRNRPIVLNVNSLISHLKTPARSCALDSAFPYLSAIASTVIPTEKS